MTRSLWLCALLAAAAGTPAMAQDADPFANRLYVAPMMSYAFSDDQRNTDDGYGGRLALGRKLGGALAIEINGFFNRFSNNEFGGNGAADVFGGGIGLLLSPFSSLRGLYAIGQVDYGHTDNLPGALKGYDSMFYSGGLGFLHRVTPAGTSLRAEVLYRSDSHDSGDAAGRSDFGEPVINLGLMIPLGQPRASDVRPGATPPAEVVPVSP